LYIQGHLKVTIFAHTGFKAI